MNRSKNGRLMKKRGVASMTVVSLIFITVMGILLAIFTTTGTQYQNINGGTTQTSLNNAIIGQTQTGFQQQVNIGNVVSVITTVSGSSTITITSTIATTTNNANQNTFICTSTTFLGGVYCGIINGECAIQASLSWLLPNTCTFVQPTSASIAVAGFLGASYQANAQSVSNNSIFGIGSGVFATALLALTTFLALGILAGLFGAGMLARVMVLAGLALTMIIFIEGQLAVFQGMPYFIWWMVNGILGAVMVIIVYEAFSNSGGVN